MKYLLAPNVLFIILNFTVFFTVSLARPRKENALAANSSTVYKWKLMDHMITENVNYIFDKYLFMMMKNRKNLNITSKCAKDTFMLLTGIRRFKSWAFKFIDSSAKGLDGLMTMKISSFGAYDECIDAIVSRNNVEKQLFRGQYCLIEFSPHPLAAKEIEELNEFLKNSYTNPIIRNVVEVLLLRQNRQSSMHKTLSLFIRLGICVPSDCTQEDIHTVIKMIAKKFYLNGEATYCETKKKNELTTVQILIIFCYSATGLLGIAGFLFDLYCQFRNIPVTSAKARILVGFSFVSNAKKVFNLEETNSTFKFLSCIRFITLIWIILGHSLIYAPSRMQSSYLNVFFEFFNNTAFQVVTGIAFHVDTFFFMSGLLLAYGILGKKIEFNIFNYVLCRYFRIFPTYAYFLMFLPLLNLMSAGPLWRDTWMEFIRYEKACSRSWWRNLLFINNFFPRNETCMPHTWYLAADFQLCIASFIIVMAFLKRPSAGITLSILGILFSMIYSEVITYTESIMPVNILNFRYYGKLEPFFQHLVYPFQHAGVYFIGIITGYFLTLKKKIKIPLKIQIVAWILVFVTNLTVVYYPAVWNKTAGGSLPSFMLYAVFGRICWALGLVWVTVCCSTGHGGVVNKILSWNAFIPLSRLTFTAYLVHPVVQLLFTGNLRTHITTSYLALVWMYFAYLVVTFMVAFSCNVFIEAPFLNLQKIIYSVIQKRSENASSACDKVNKTVSTSND